MNNINNELIDLNRIVESTTQLNERTSGSGGLMDYVTISGYNNDNYIFFNSKRSKKYSVQIPVDFHTLVYERESKKTFLKNVDSFLKKENCYLVVDSYTPQEREQNGLGRTFRAKISGKLMYFPHDK